MKTKIIFFFCLITAAKSTVFAQTVINLTMAQAIEMGVKNSNYLTIDEAKLLAADADLIAAKDKKLPDFKLSTSYVRILGSNVDFKNSNPNATPSQSPSQALYGIANFSYPIYAGGRINYGIEAAGYLKEAVRLGADADKNMIAYNIAQAFNNIFKASKAVEVLNENLSASKKRDSTFFRLEENGLLARNDRLKAQLQTNNIELQLLDAQTNYDLANLAMSMLLGLDEKTIINPDSSYADVTSTTEPFSYYEEQAFKNRKELAAIGLREKAGDLNIKMAQAQALPTVALTGGYIAADIPKVLTITNAINFGVGVQYNLANLWKKNTSLLKARAQNTELSANESILKDDIKLTVSRDYQQTVYANKKIEILSRALEQSEENLRITKNKYDNSLVTVTDLIEADAALAAAKVNVMNAKADAALALKKLQQSAGILY